MNSASLELSNSQSQSGNSPNGQNSFDASSTGANHNLLEAVFNTSTLALHVLESIRDANGRITDFNITLTNKMSDKIAGRKVMGMRMLEGWPHTKDIGLFDMFIHTVETGEALDYEQLYEGDGVKAWFRWLAAKLNDGLYVTIEDITARKNNEQALKDSAARLQSTIDGVPVLLALLEPVFHGDNEPVDFLISSANQSTAKFSGLSPADLIGRRMTDLYPEAFRGQIKENYIKVFKSGEPLDVEFFYPALDRWLSISVTKQNDGKGIVVAASDVTERKKIEEGQKRIEILTSLDKIKTEFFNNISHELRTPLALILGPLQEVMGNKSLPKHQLQKLEMVRRNTQRLRKLVNSLLDFARVESGRFEIIYQPTDLAEFTMLLASNFRSAFEKVGLKFIVSVESGEPVYINRDMWEKIVFNLLSNALKFTFNGTVEVILKVNRHHVNLHVIDTGIGINPENLAKIFERFVRVENVKARTYEGSGIGLALVKELVSMHGGNIKVKSRPLSGSEFIVSIPKGKKHLPGRSVHEFNDRKLVSTLAAVYQDEVETWSFAEQKAFKQSTDGDQKPCILLVDDNSDLREYIRSILSNQYSVVTVSNGMKAMEAIDKGLHPDFILADIMMPEMNGYDFLKKIKASSRLSTIPFVFLSAKASEEDKIHGLKIGADGYLIKPFSAQELLATVSSKIATYKKAKVVELAVEDKLHQSINDLELSSGIILKQKRLLHQALNAFPNPVWMFDSSKKLNFVNDKWITFTGLIETDMNSCLERVHVNHSDLQPDIDPCISRGVPYEGTCLLKSKDGNLHLYYDYAVPVKNDDNEIDMWLRFFTSKADDKSLVLSKQTEAKNEQPPSKRKSKKTTF